MGIGRAGDGSLGLVAVRTLPHFCRSACRVPCWRAARQRRNCRRRRQAEQPAPRPAARRLGFWSVWRPTPAPTTRFATFPATRQGAEQDAIAQAAGELPVGGEAEWKIEHTIPIGNEHGRLRVAG